ncbi:hypothetical protein [Flavobacterium anhuiense]|uniref:hypothetical protein n=1 Tax=Flavobacterium anhuiense TaxID=459526 RepID=UPI003D9676ED
MNFAKEARKLADFISDLEDDFILYSYENDYNYTHIGALLTNIILQAGLNYNTVVKPRVEKVLLQYPNHNTTSKFQELINSDGLENIINWKHHTKLNRMYDFVDFLMGNNINTCFDLKEYLLSYENQKEVLNLEGIGPKTVDYLLKLLNFDVVAVDRHIYNFVEMAEVEIKGYDYTKKTVEYAADFLDIPRKVLDYSIWSYMSNKDFTKSNKESQLMLEF